MEKHSDEILGDVNNNVEISISSFVVRISHKQEKTWVEKITEEKKPKEINYNTAVCW